jgi:hypothetical protein
MWTEASVKAAFGADAADKDVGTILDAVAPTLVRLLNREVTGKEASAELEGAVALGKSLAGRSKIEQKGSALDLRGTTIDKLDTGDVAGGDLTKLTSIVVNIGGQAFEITERTPYHDIEQGIVAVLKDVNQVTLGDAVGLLKVESAAATIGPVWAVARGLLQTDFATLICVVKAIATATCGKLEKVIDFAAPFCWVPQEAAEAVLAVVARPPTERGVAVNSKTPSTGLAYVNRAPGRRTDRVVSLVNSGYGEEAVEHIRDEVVAYLQSASVCEPDDDNCFGTVTGLGMPLFVVLPPPAPDPTLLDELRAALPGVVFIILAGDGLDARQRFADLQLQHVDFLTPELAAGVEADARQQTINVRTLANIACNG